MKTFNMYCDESCHLENDRNDIIIISYISSAYNQVQIHNEQVREIKKKYGFPHEIKWSSVSKSKKDFYLEIIEYFFATDLQFRAIVAKKEHKDLLAEEYDDFYYMLYYHLLFHKINMNYNYNIYLDIKDTRSAAKVHRLKEVLNLKYNSSIRTLQNIRSEESLLLQMGDLIMGAISYYLRNMDTVIAKNKIVEKIISNSHFHFDKSKINNPALAPYFIDLK